MNQRNAIPGMVNWTGYLAITLLLLLPLAVITVRSGAWQQGLMLYALACLGSTLVVIVTIVLLMLPRFAGWRAAIVKRAALALPGTLLLLGLTTGGDYPRIHNITTDTQDPPAFVTAAEQRGTGANPLEADPEAIAAQLVAYGDLTPLASPLAPDAAFDRALQVAADLGWEVYHQDRSAGIIEAVETTRIMGFKDDVVIRVRAAPGGSAIDLRSVSRVGQGDIGANAKRIRGFIAAFAQSR